MLRVLCLHDADSDASNMKDDFTLLGERLYAKHIIDLVYVSSPLNSSPSIIQAAGDEINNDDSNKSHSGIDSNPSRVWWELRQEQVQPLKESKTVEEKECGSRQEENTTSTTGVYYHLGLDASLMMLRQIWISMPFHGILAVGQGATVASVLCLLPDLKPRPKFAVFLNGEAMLPEKERLVDEQSFPCLHIMNSQADPSAPRLVEQFGGEVYHQEEESKGSLLTNTNMNIIGKFLVNQKKRFKKRMSAAGNNVLILQNQLHLVEQRASQLIAETILENPPPSLVSMIAPNKELVGAWSGSKRREPDQDGGGAPCPSEFLLRPNHRPSGDSNIKKDKQAR